MTRMATVATIATIATMRTRLPIIAIAAVVAALSAAFAGYMLGEIRIDPRSTLWLNESDIAQHFLGWHFFRGEPWALPLGVNPRYGLGMGSSVVFTDSIPLLAIFFKVFDAWLPTHFQYAGIWMVFCFVAQGLCALALLRKFSTNPVILLVGSSFFVLSPAMVARTLGHFALVGQWTMLFALYLYFTPDSATKYLWRWRWLIVVTGLIHGYLLYFVLAIWATTLLRDCRLPRHQTYKKIAFNAFVTIWVMLISMWLGGWFEVPLGAAASGSNYGNFAANLLALVNPPWGSPIVPTFAQAPTASGMESVNYLGAGIIALGALAMVCVLAKRQTFCASMLAHKWLLLTACAFAFIAFSNSMYLGETLVLHLPLPDAVRSKLEFVRGSGRLLWLMHYLIILLAVIVVARSFSPLLASAIVLVSFAVQVYDFTPSYRAYASHLRSLAESAVSSATASPPSPFWPIAALNYRELNFYPITHYPARYEQIALWAGDNHVAINAACFARISPKRAFANNANLEAELSTGNRRSDTLYVLQNRDDVSRLLLKPGDGIGEIDGHLIVAPNWFECCQKYDPTVPMKPLGSWSHLK